MKKKAFTLTELLVVVVIIGTLAAVVLPKFTQVLESRRTTEAENIMRAVRSEQEARCTLDKNYTAQASELASFPANEGNNYTYVLNDRGIFARSRHKNYTLRMPSYRTGEICCDGDDCGSLGKGYSGCMVRVVADECAATDVPGSDPNPVEPPDTLDCQLKDYERSCSEVLNNDNWSGTIEYIVNADCTGHIEKKFCSCALPAKSPEPCGAGQTGNITWTIDSENCTYVKQENCTQQVCEEGQEQNVVETCTSRKGERCHNNAWESFTEEIASTDCRKGCGKPSKTQTCSDGKTVQTAQYSCNESNGKWVLSGWDPATCPNTCPESAGDPQHCADPQDDNTVAGVWQDFPTCKCICPRGSTLIGDQCYRDSTPSGGGELVCNWVVDTAYTGKYVAACGEPCDDHQEVSGPQQCNESTNGQTYRSYVVYSTCPGGSCMADLFIQTCVCE